MTTYDTSVPETLGAFLGIAAYHKQVGPQCELLGFTLDFSHAYKHVPILAPQRDFATIMLVAPCGVPHTATLRSQPFGSRRAPANWARVTELPKWLLAEFFDISIAIYVDDIHCAEPKATCESSFLVIKAVCRLLGFELDFKKEHAPSKSFSLLGAQVTVSEGFCEASLPDRKRLATAHDLEVILKGGRLTPAQAAKVRGRLGFSQSLFFGRVGRALLGPFSDRQYTAATGTHHPLTDDIREALQWWIQCLERATPRRVSFNPQSPVLVYTDACGAGHIGVTLFCEGAEHRANTHLPPWFDTKKELIGEYELAAGIFWGMCSI